MSRLQQRDLITTLGEGERERFMVNSSVVHKPEAFF